ncbi:MAG: hypothetical protein PHH06_00425 [Candidatus Gracilibacteria bacterium]|nr:hypothetical protein [Candidatus Gracilibacteria bacterium]
MIFTQNGNEFTFNKPFEGPDDINGFVNFLRNEGIIGEIWLQNNKSGAILTIINEPEVVLALKILEKVNDIIESKKIA